MIIYVAHCYGNKPENFERAKRITHNLQVNDFDNTYICPLIAFSHMKRGEIRYDAEMENRIDVLSVCDKLIVASEFSKSVCQEIDFANNVHMEVEYLEDTK